MRKYISFVLLVVFVLSVSSVCAQVKPAAASAGYHNILYTDRVDTSTVGLTDLSIFANAFVQYDLWVGMMSANGGLLIRSPSGDGNYVFGVNPGKKITLNSPVDVSGSLLASTGVNALKYCDVSGANCINNLANVPVVGSCPANQYVVRTTSAGVVCSGVDASNITGDVIPGSCPANQYVVGTTATGVACSDVSASNVTGDVVVGSCPAGQVVKGTTTTGVTCAVDATGSSVWTQTGNDIYSAVTGNVGIGTTNPTQKLDVNGGIVSTGSITASTAMNSGKYCDVTGNSCINLRLDHLTVAVDSSASSYFSVGVNDVRAYTQDNYVHILGYLKLKGVWQTPNYELAGICLNVQGLPADFPIVTEFDGYYTFPCSIYYFSNLRGKVLPYYSLAGNLNKMCFDLYDEPSSTSNHFDTNTVIWTKASEYGVMLDFTYPISPP